MSAWPVTVLERPLPWLAAAGRQLLAPLGFVPAVAWTVGAAPVLASLSHDHSAHASVAAGDPWQLDAAAGCEFVDDRIRHPE